jgi:hypothetical protein
MEEEFHMMHREDSGSLKEPPKKKVFASLYTNGKYKLMASLYNYVHPCKPKFSYSSGLTKAIFSSYGASPFFRFSILPVGTLLSR